MAPVKIVGVVFLATLYLLSPIDLLPDVIPLLGWGDDAVVLVTAWKSISKLLSGPTPAGPTA